MAKSIVQAGYGPGVDVGYIGHEIPSNVAKGPKSAL
jgi:hypothetical protein